MTLPLPEEKLITIYFKRPGFSERNLSTNWEIVLHSKCSHSSPTLLQVSWKGTDFRVFNSPSTGSQRVSKHRRQDRVVVVGQQAETEPWKVHNCLETSNNNIFRYLKKSLEHFAKNIKQGTMVKIGSQES